MVDFHAFFHLMRPVPCAAVQHTGRICSFGRSIRVASYGCPGPLGRKNRHIRPVDGGGWKPPSKGIRRADNSGKSLYKFGQMFSTLWHTKNIPSPLLDDGFLGSLARNWFILLFRRSNCLLSALGKLFRPPMLCDQKYTRRAAALRPSERLKTALLQLTFSDRPTCWVFSL